MARTFFWKFNRHDGTPLVTVEYSISEGSPDTYSPMYGACGGDACEVEIVKAFDDNGPVIFTDDENEKWCEHICEHHEFDYDDEPAWL